MSTPRIAISAPDGDVTYEQLDEAASRVAGALLAGRDDLGGARVAFLVPPSFAYAAVLRGTWRAGGVAVPLAVSHPPAELDYVIRDAEADVVVAAPGYLPALAPLCAAAGVRLITTDEALAAPALTAHPHLGAGRRALIIYTSGTTGRPKGVVTTHAGLGAQVSALVSAWGWTPADRILLVLPLHHVHGLVNGLITALAVGGTCEMLPAFDAGAVWRRLASGDITVFTAVPTIYLRLIAAWEAASPDVQRAWSAGAGRLRLMMSGSAALPVTTLERWRILTGHTLLERYGMTELGMALSNPLDGERRPGSVGAPLPGVEVRLVRESGDVIPDDAEPGELEVRGATVFLEYWRRPEETQVAFREGWFRTGDVAVRDRGAYRLLGRTSVDIIKTGGYKVSALEIEEVLRRHPAVAECAVVGVADAEWGERVSAVVEARPDAPLSLELLQAWAREELAPYKVPRALRIVEALPRNAMGKVVKPELAALLATAEPE